MTQGEEEARQKRDPDREPLRQLSRANPAVPVSTVEHGPVPAIPQTSTCDPAQPRDWILPVPANKPEPQENWKEKRKDMMEDLSLCVDVSTSTILEAGESEVEDEVDLSEILGDLD